MVANMIGLTIFAAVLAWGLFTAFRDGRISYGHVSSRFLYVERKTQPRRFWLVVSLGAVTMMMVVAELARLAMRMSLANLA